MTFSELEKFLLRHLRQDIMPFWMKFSIDWKHGGMFTCIGDDGKVLSTDKYIWSNARALWTFAALCNTIENREDWRQAAHNQFEFLRKHGRDDAGCWVFLVDAAGNLKTGPDSIVVDAFALYGLIEYYKLTNDDEALGIARETYLSVAARLACPGSYATAPYPTPPGMRPQREAMQFSYAFTQLGKLLDCPEILEHGLRLGRDVLNLFYRSDRDVVLEYINLDGSVADTPAGRAMVPGHGIETLWFQIENFRMAGVPECSKRAAQAMRCCFEKGWDPEYGGLFLGIDVEGRQPVYWKNADKKLWWPFTEALPGCLLAFEEIREQWCLDWYWKCHDWAFRHFPDREHGEWIQRLDRFGNPVNEVIALPVKDPFHLPRGLMKAIETLRRDTWVFRHSSFNGTSRKSKYYVKTS